MPELPEVEVVKRSLEKNIVNLTIKKVKINNNKLRYKIRNKSFAKIIGHKILFIKRRSKYLLFNLDKNITMLVHLGMTGKFFIVNKKKETKKTSFYYNLGKNDKKHNHIIFDLSKNIQLIYNDVRKFGFIKIISSAKIYSNPHIKILGIEPLSKKFNYDYFKKFINGKKRKIKDILMDQKYISGLGNIYVNEILFSSGISPSRKVFNLKDIEIRKIVKNTKAILKKSIKIGGSSIKNFNDSKGKTGSFQQKFNVYGRAGEKCHKFNCLSVIDKINISNRASFYCKNCQK